MNKLANQQHLEQSRSPCQRCKSYIHESEQQEEEWQESIDSIKRQFESVG